MDVRELVRVVLSDYDAGETAVLQHREELRAAGKRLVSHEQLDDGRLELRDAITGEELFTPARGGDGPLGSLVGGRGHRRR